MQRGRPEGHLHSGTGRWSIPDGSKSRPELHSLLTRPGRRTALWTVNSAARHRPEGHLPSGQAPPYSNASLKVLGYLEHDHPRSDTARPTRGICNGDGVRTRWATDGPRPPTPACQTPRGGRLVHVDDIVSTAKGEATALETRKVGVRVTERPRNTT